MGVFNRFEKGLERAVNGAFAKAFKSEVQPVEIASALRKAADERAAVIGHGRTLIPNVFVVELGATDHDRLYEFSEELATEFADNLVDYATEQGYAFVGPVSVKFHEVPDLDTGVFRVQASSAKGPSPRSSARPESAPAPAPRLRPTGFEGFNQPPVPEPSASAAPWLEIGGQRYELNPDRTCLGRGDEADIVVDDPGISRQHAEITLQPSFGTVAAHIRDLGSTNGTFISANRITSTPLSDGAQITMGRTRITFRQEST